MDYLFARASVYRGKCGGGGEGDRSQRQRVHRHQGRQHQVQRAAGRRQQEVNSTSI